MKEQLQSDEEKAMLAKAQESLKAAEKTKASFNASVNQMSVQFTNKLANKATELATLQKPSPVAAKKKKKKKSRIM